MLPRIDCQNMRRSSGCACPSAIASHNERRAANHCGSGEALRLSSVYGNVPDRKANSFKVLGFPSTGNHRNHAHLALIPARSPFDDRLTRVTPLREFPHVADLSIVSNPTTTFLTLLAGATGPPNIMHDVQSFLNNNKSTAAWLMARRLTTIS